MNTYTVKAGDSLSLIAQKLGIPDWRVLLDLNPEVTNPDMIYVGQVLRLPDSSSSSAPSLPQKVKASLGGDWVKNPYVWIGASVLTGAGILLTMKK